MIPVLEYDLRINQGSRFEQPFIVKENGAVKDLTGYTARMHIREWKDSASFLAEYTTANNRIVIAPTAGRVTVIVPGTITDDYTFGDGFYDIEIVDSGGEPIRFAEGRISLSRETTR